MARRATLHGKPVIVLEETDKYMIVVEEEAFNKKCEDILVDVAQNQQHPLRGKTLAKAILEDAENKLGYRKYLKDLIELGVIKEAGGENA